jgi:hypothetical protein
LKTGYESNPSNRPGSSVAHIHIHTYMHACMHALIHTYTYRQISGGGHSKKNIRINEGSKRKNSSETRDRLLHDMPYVYKKVKCTRNLELGNIKSPYSLWNRQILVPRLANYNPDFEYRRTDWKRLSLNQQTIIQINQISRGH